MRCNQFLLNEVDNGKTTINTLEFNLFCEIIKEQPIEITEQALRPSKRSCSKESSSAIAPFLRTDSILHLVSCYLPMCLGFNLINLNSPRELCPPSPPYVIFTYCSSSSY